MINWQAVDTVLLDLDGTLLDLHFDNYFWLHHLPQRYAEHHGLEPEPAKVELTALIQSYRGTLQWYCLDHWSELVKMDITELKKEVKHKIQKRPHSEAFLRYLKAQNKEVVLATNAHRKGLKLKLEVAQIGPWLDQVVSSHDYQEPKESQGFWLQIAQQIGFNKERTLFIDDNVEVLQSAEQFGIGYLVCINQPDSQQQAQASGRFMDIIDFDEIMSPSSASN